MTDVKNFDNALTFVDSVVNQVWTVNEFTNSRPLSDGAAHVREAGK
jgi:hypothetical protein